MAEQTIQIADKDTLDNVLEQLDINKDSLASLLTKLQNSIVKKTNITATKNILNNSSYGLSAIKNAIGDISSEYYELSVLLSGCGDNGRNLPGIYDPTLYNELVSDKYTVNYLQFNGYSDNNGGGWQSIGYGSGSYPYSTFTGSGYVNIRIKGSVYLGIEVDGKVLFSGNSALTGVLPIIKFNESITIFRTMSQGSDNWALGQIYYHK